jgi:hypothetical protein
MNTKIEVTGVIPARQDEAKQEIAGYLGAFHRTFSPDVPIMRVTVAEDFEKEVDKTVSGKTRYSARRQATQAVGRTLYKPGKDSISFSVVMDGRFVRQWTGDEQATRFELFMHEFLHAYLSWNRYKNLGASKFEQDTRTIEGVCLSIALTRDEYIVDSYLDEMCKRVLTDSFNQPLGLHRLNLGRRMDFLAAFMMLLDGMPAIVDANVSAFRKKEKDMQEIWRTLSMYVEELLASFAHLAGSREKEPDWPEITRSIYASPAYERFLTGHLKAIYREWINYFLENYDEAACLETTAHAVREIFHNCGLRFKNVPEGIHISAV